MCFVELISVGYEDTKYFINRFVLRGLDGLLKGLLTLRN